MRESKHAAYRSGYKYQLAADLFLQTTLRPPQPILTDYICLGCDGLMLLKKGYCSDGPSGPTIDTRSSIRWAFGHDGLYQLIRLGHLPAELRKECDRNAYAGWVADGMWKWRAKLWLRELNKFGGPAADPKNIKRVHLAPGGKL